MIKPQLHIRYVLISPDIHYLRVGELFLRVTFFLHLFCILFLGPIMYIYRSRTSLFLFYFYLRQRPSPPPINIIIDFVMNPREPRTILSITFEMYPFSNQHGYDDSRRFKNSEVRGFRLRIQTIIIKILHTCCTKNNCISTVQATIDTLVYSKCDDKLLLINYSTID